MAVEVAAWIIIIAFVGPALLLLGTLGHGVIGRIAGAIEDYALREQKRRHDG